MRRERTDDDATVIAGSVADPERFAVIYDRHAAREEARAYRLVQVAAPPGDQAGHDEQVSADVTATAQRDRPIAALADQETQDVRTNSTAKDIWYLSSGHYLRSAQRAALYRAAAEVPGLRWSATRRTPPGVGARASPGRTPAVRK